MRVLRGGLSTSNWLAGKCGPSATRITTKRLACLSARCFRKPSGNVTFWALRMRFAIAILRPLDRMPRNPDYGGPSIEVGLPRRQAVGARPKGSLPFDEHLLQSGFFRVFAAVASASMASVSLRSTGGEQMHAMPAADLDSQIRSPVGRIDQAGADRLEGRGMLNIYTCICRRYPLKSHGSAREAGRRSESRPQRSAMGFEPSRSADETTGTNRRPNGISRPQRRSYKDDST